MYLGLRTFGARASAANFDGEAMARAVEYAHLHHVRVYVTVNTLVTAAELPEVYQALRTIALARADAVIVQDMGVAALAQSYFPTLDLHASTQMGLHTAEGAAWAKEKGMKRVVLARECPLGEIARVAKTGIETEVFVHGALCAGVSGQCLMSSMAGGRSGNRGRCAQPCRQDVRLGEHGGALLSMKDLCLRDHLPELVAAGVTSLKIEGRLKRPEYVAVVTDSYRQALDEIKAGSFRPQNEKEKDRLMQAFHRGGFTRGHAMGAEDADLCETGHVSHGGARVGQVLQIKNELATLSLCRDLNDGDSLQLRGAVEMDVRYSGKDRKAGEEAILRLRTPGPKAGDPVYRLTDAKQMEWARGLREPLIPIALKAVLQEGQPMALTLSASSVEATVEGEIPQAARTRALSLEDVEKQLTKLGDTPYTLDTAAFDVEDGLFVPVAALNALRREAAQRLTQKRVESFFGREKEERLQKQIPPETMELSWLQSARRAGDPVSPWAEELAVSFRQVDMAQSLMEAGATRLMYEPWDLRGDALEKAIQGLPEGTWLKLPPFTSSEALEKLQNAANAHKNKLSGVVLGSIGQAGVKFDLPVALGGGVPVTNGFGSSVLLSDNEPAFFTLWPEWSYLDLEAMPVGRIPRFLTVYGREKAMLLHHCPKRVAIGLTAGRAACTLCKGEGMACGLESAALTDRKGYRFPLTRTVEDAGCIVNVLAALPVDLSKYEGQRKILNAGMHVNLTVEEPEEQLRIVRYFKKLLEGGAPETGADTTAGYFLRGVE